MLVVYIFFTVYFTYIVKMNSGVLRLFFRNCGSYFALANISKGGLWINKISSWSCSHNHGQNRLSVGAAGRCSIHPGSASEDKQTILEGQSLEIIFSKVYCKNS